jgi:CBS domain-containing protein
MKVRDAMQRHVTTVREQDRLSVARELMRWSELSVLPVLDAKKRVMGLISEHDLLRALTTDPAAGLTRSVYEFMSVLIEHAQPDADLAEVAAHMSQERLDCLPVSEADTLLGMLSVGDALNALAQQPPATSHEGAPTVSAIMHPEPIAVPRQATLLATAARMAERGVRHACVIDENRRVIGIISDRDVRRVLGHPKRALVPNYVPAELRRLGVEQVMSTPTTLSQDASIDQAVSLLLSGQFSALPVTDASGRLRGIVSYIDLLRHLRHVVAGVGQLAGERDEPPARGEWTAPAH